MVAGSALLLPIGGVAWSVQLNRKQHDEAKAKLDQAETESKAHLPAIDALVVTLPRATEILDYVAIYASHSVKKWIGQMPTLPLQCKM